eukprot:2117516-Amphidinium_carterae.1
MQLGKSISVVLIGFLIPRCFPCSRSRNTTAKVLLEEFEQVISTQRCKRVPHNQPTTCLGVVTSVWELIPSSDIQSSFVDAAISSSGGFRLWG